MTRIVNFFLPLLPVGLSSELYFKQAMYDQIDIVDWLQFLLSKV